MVYQVNHGVFSGPVLVRHLVKIDQNLAPEWLATLITLYISQLSASCEKHATSFFRSSYPPFLFHFFRYP